ncbi:MAG: hypothetical protein LDL31_01260 [Prosthecobacter sp.]|nr:hypothetical protein [Prosthecobacter sp.]
MLSGLFPCQAQISSIENLNLLLSQSTSQKQAVPPTSSLTDKVAANPNTFYAKPGPWGILRCAYIYLEAPKSLVDSFPLPNTQPRWAFPETSLPKLPEYFAAIGLSKAMIESLLDPKTVVKSNGMVYLFPRPADIEGLETGVRATLYTELASNPENEFHADPVLILSDNVRDWYRTSKLRPDLVEKIEKLSYKRGQTWAFSDVQLLLGEAQGDQDARNIFKSMTRTRGNKEKIEADHNSNIEEIVGYWTLGIGLRRKDVEPLLQSIVDTDGIEAMPLSHMLPPLVRKLLYTYPSFDMAREGLLPDCHWTCLNFFNYDPHEYLLDSRLATSSVLERFEPVEPPYKYGDILFFLNKATGDAYHSCVHLADDLVYTKNGRNLLSPWLIMRRQDVEKIYLYRGDGRVQGFRLKKAPQG